MKQWLGCSRVIAWNSVVRRNAPEDVQLKEVEQQKEPEKGFIPTTRLQPIAGVAHVDQDSVWGYELCRRAVGERFDDAKRVMIVNTWRPLQGECETGRFCTLHRLTRRPGHERPIGCVPVHPPRQGRPQPARQSIWDWVRRAP